MGGICMELRSRQRRGPGPTRAHQGREGTARDCLREVSATPGPVHSVTRNENCSTSHSTPEKMAGQDHAATARRPGAREPRGIRTPEVLHPFFLPSRQDLGKTKTK